MQQAGDVLHVRWAERGPELRVRYSDADYVQIEATEIGKRTEWASSLARTDRRFEVAFDDLDAVLSEMNTLIEVQATLQDLTRGYLFNTWNGGLNPPELVDTDDAESPESPAGESSGE